jgi:hypothetical protein
VRPVLVEDNELVPLLGRIMSVRRRKELLQRLNALDTGTTEDACRAEREARMRKAIQIEETLNWGRISADSL